MSLLAAIAVALGLFYLINRVEGHVRFVPLLAGLVLLYALGKALHLSPLILMLVCGPVVEQPAPARVERAPAGVAQHRLREDPGRVQGHRRGTRPSPPRVLLPDARLLDGGKPYGGLASLGDRRCNHRRHLREPNRHPEAAAEPDRRRLVWLAPRGLITVLLFLTAAETGKLAGFPFGAVMLVVLVTASATAFAHRGASPAPAGVSERVTE